MFGGTTTPRDPDADVREALRRRSLSPGQKELVLNSIRYVRRVVERFDHRWGKLIPADDLVQEAHVGIHEITRTYDQSKGPFPQFAAHHVAWHLMMAVRKEAKYRHYIVPYCVAHAHLKWAADPADPMHDTDETIHANLMHFSDSLAAGMFMAVVTELSRMSGDWLEAERIAYQEARVGLRKALSTLDEGHYRVLKMSFEDEIRLEDIAQTLGVHHSTARRWRQEALVQLAYELRVIGIDHAPTNPLREGDGEIRRAREGDGGGDDGGSGGGSSGKVIPFRRSSRGL